MPRQASPAIRAAASSWVIWPPPASQNRADTCAIPTSDTASSSEASSGRPVSVRITSAIIDAHSVVTRSTRSRTAGSLVRSDSKTSRNAPSSDAT
jgi:hypothetical protein